MDHNGSHGNGMTTSTTATGDWKNHIFTKQSHYLYRSPAGTSNLQKHPVCSVTACSSPAAVLYHCCFVPALLARYVTDNTLSRDSVAALLLTSNEAQAGMTAPSLLWVFYFISSS